MSARDGDPIGQMTDALRSMRLAGRAPSYFRVTPEQLTALLGYVKQSGLPVDGSQGGQNQLCGMDLVIADSAADKSRHARGHCCVDFARVTDHKDTPA